MVCFALTLAPYNLSFLFKLRLVFQSFTSLKPSLFSRADAFGTVFIVKFLFCILFKKKSMLFLNSAIKRIEIGY